MAKDSSKQLQELNSYGSQEAADPRQWKLQRERLQADFTRALDNFQRAQRSAAQKEKDAIKKFKTAGGQTAETDLIDIEGGGGANRAQMMMQEEQNLEHLVERERAVNQLEADIMDVNQIFKDLAAMVHDQGEMVDSIEANVETSSIRVNEGTEQLRQAERYQVRPGTWLAEIILFSSEQGQEEEDDTRCHWSGRIREALKYEIFL